MNNMYDTDRVDITTNWGMSKWLYADETKYIGFLTRLFIKCSHKVFLTLGDGVVR